MLANKHLNSTVKIIAKDSNGNNLNLFTGFFYSPPRSDFRNFSNDKFVITAKHCLHNEDIQSLNLSFISTDTQKVVNFELQLNKFEIIDIPNVDLSIIKFEAVLPNSFVLQQDFYSKSMFNPVLNTYVKIPGFYNININIPIVENSFLVSNYSQYVFYIKSKNIINGYSGAPVYTWDTSGTIVYLLGIVSKEVENDNIEIVSIENFIDFHKIINR